jgi:hypothetical protein
MSLNVNATLSNNGTSADHEDKRFKKRVMQKESRNAFVSCFYNSELEKTVQFISLLKAL